MVYIKWLCLHLNTEWLCLHLNTEWLCLHLNTEWLCLHLNTEWLCLMLYGFSGGVGGGGVNQCRYSRQFWPELKLFDLFFWTSVLPSHRGSLPKFGRVPVSPRMIWLGVCATVSFYVLYNNEPCSGGLTIHIQYYSQYDITLMFMW